MTVAEASEEAGEICVCVNDSSGRIQLIGTDEECKKNETKICWNKQNAPGGIDPEVLGRIEALETQVATLQEQMSTLIDDDTLPKLSINDVSVLEGDNDEIVFTVMLSKPSQDYVGFEWKLIHIDTSYKDFSPYWDYDKYSSPEYVEILPGDVSTTISFPIVDDADPEIDERFYVNIVAVYNANCTKNQGIGIILNDDIPNLTVRSAGDYYIEEGDQSFFEVSLSKRHVTEVTVDYEIIGQEATADDDFIPQTDQLVFEPGETEIWITCETVDDDIAEPAEGLSLVLSNAVNANIFTSSALKYIACSDIIFDFEDLGDIIEGSTDPVSLKSVYFTINIPEPLPHEIRIGYNKQGSYGAGYAILGMYEPGVWIGDITPWVEGNTTIIKYITIPANATSAEGWVYILQDEIPEDDEGFKIQLFNEAGNVFEDGKSYSFGTIINDD